MSDIDIKVKWPKVLDYHDMDQRPLLVWMDLGNCTLYRISAYFCKMGSLYPADGLVVAIERVGMWFFKIHSDMNFLTWQYVSEKLNTYESDARIMADWINTQLGFSDFPQQGRYHAPYIRAVEPYGLVSELFKMPLCPEIIQ